MSEKPAEERFKRNIDDLVYLILTLVEEGIQKGLPCEEIRLIRVACDFIISYDAVKMIEDFVYHGGPYWDQIKAHADVFFVKNVVNIFGKLPLARTQLSSFTGLFVESDKPWSLDPEDKDTLWKYFEALTCCSLSYMRDHPDFYAMMRQKLLYEKKPTYDLDLERLWIEWKMDQPAVPATADK